MPMPRIIAEKMAALAEAHRKSENAREYVSKLVLELPVVPEDWQFAAVAKANEADMHALIILRVQAGAVLKAYGEQLEAEEKAAVQMDQTLRSLA